MQRIKTRFLFVWVRLFIRVYLQRFSLEFKAEKLSKLRAEVFNHFLLSCRAPLRFARFKAKCFTVTQ